MANIGWRRGIPLWARRVREKDVVNCGKGILFSEMPGIIGCKTISKSLQGLI